MTLPPPGQVGPAPASPLQKAASALVAEQDRWILWLPVGLGLGIALYFALPAEPPLLLGLGLLAGLAATAWWGRRRLGVLVVAGLVATVVLGFTVVQWRAALVAAPMLQDRFGPATIEGRIVGLETLPSALRVTLDRPRVGGLPAHETPETLRVTLRGDQPPLSPGAWVRLRGILTPPPPPAAPGAFDFQRQSYFRRLGAVGFGFGAAEVTAEPAPGGLDALKLGLAELRQALSQRIRGQLEGPSGAVAAALTTGERRAVPEPVMDAIRDSGLAHLLAISGLHIGLVAGILFFGLRAGLALVPRLALRAPIKKWAAAVAIVGALVYALLAGATVPTLRAFLMIGLVLVAVMVDRRGLSMRLVAWAATVILLLRPESLLGASFQLSFAAVTALVAVFEALSRMRGRLAAADRSDWRWRLALYLGGVALTTLVASGATAPFAIYHFNRLAAYGLAANMVAVPLTALWIMPWGVVALLLMPMGLEAAALLPMDWGIRIVIGVARAVADWPGAVTLLPALPSWALGMVAAGGLWLCLWQGRWRAWGLGAVAAGMAVLALVRPPDILIDGDGRLTAVRDPDGGLVVSNLRRSRFERDVWLRRVGGGPATRWPRGAEAAHLGDGRRLRCDRLGCIYRTAGQTVALAREPAALIDDCRSAGVVVSLVPVRRPCGSARVVVDRFDLWRNGAHALWLRPDGRVRVESVNRSRGHRPWVIRPEGADEKPGAGS